MGISQKAHYHTNSVMEFRTYQCRALKGLFDSLKDHITDISFFFSRTGMKVMQFSGVQIFLVNIDLDGESFEHFYCRSEQPVELNVSLSNIHKIFKAVNNEDDYITWIYRDHSEALDEDDNPEDILTIKITSEKKNEERIYDIRLQDPDEDMKYGEITGASEFPYSLTMPSADLQHICRNLKNLGAKYVDITHDGKTLCFETKTDICTNRIVKQGQTGRELDETKNIKFTEAPANSTFKDRFSFDLLNSFSKCAQTGSSGGGGNIVRMFLKQEHPLILKFSIGSLGELDVAIAPRENDDDPMAELD